LFTFSAGLEEDIDETLAAEIAAQQDAKEMKFGDKGQGQTEVPVSPSALALMNRLTEYV